MDKFKIGDRVKIRYISDNNIHNNKVGVIKTLRAYNYYPNKDTSSIIQKVQGNILYEDGTILSILDMYRENSGLVCKIEKEV